VVPHGREYRSGMREILPDLWFWTTIHPVLGIEVASYWRDDAGILFDPLVTDPSEVDWFAARTVQPAAVLLSNRHHYRSSAIFAERFGCRVFCNRAGLHEFTAGQEVQGFDIGDALPGGVIACEVGVLCPDDTAFWMPVQRAMLFADGLVAGAPHGHPRLGFVPDVLMDDPPATKAGLLAAFRRLLADYPFEHVLLAHGGPVPGDGRRALEQLIAEGGRTAFEL
jgi:glyoxylase-like metal-dependent hydrolase (beta-lactamase superfamily II)